jgi:hypothetical protein
MHIKYFQDEEIRFWVYSLLHTNLSLILFSVIVLFPSTNLYFKTSVVIWLTMKVAEFFDFFKCLEKKTLREVSWDGIYEILPYLKIAKNKKNINKISYYFSLTTFYFILYKIYL